MKQALTHPTVWNAFFALAAQDPDAPVLVAGDQQHTRQQLRDRAMAISEGLAAAGIVAGQRIGLWMPNSLEWVAILLAASRLGVAVVALNTRYRSAELADILRHSEAVALLTFDQDEGSGYLDILTEIAPDFAPAAPAQKLESLPHLKHVIVAGNRGRQDLFTIERLVAGGCDVAISAAGDARAVLVVLYTSGTTAAAKGVLQTNGALLENARLLSDWTGLQPTDRMLMVTPFCGIYGLNALLAILLCGGVALVPPTVDADESLDYAQRHRATTLSATVDTFMRRWAARQRARPRDLSAMRGHVVVSAWLMGDAAIELPEFESLFGITIIQPYGLSEANSMILLGNPRASQSERILGNLWPVGSEVEFSLRVPGSADETPPGEMGEMCLRGPMIMLGYLKNQAATEAAVDPQGWLRTGDLGQQEPNGAVRYKGRSKDILKIAGFTVAPAEVENFLCRYPGVAAAQVVGIKDRRGGDVIAAAIVRSPGAEFTDSDLIGHCSRNMASFKIPRLIGFMDEFPITPGPNGDKVQKVAIRQALSALLASREAEAK